MNISVNINAVNSNELIRKLKKFGVEIDTSYGKGSHARLLLAGRSTVIPRHGKRELAIGTVRIICRQLGIDPKDL
ncbi:MAG: type II toxin-antitoxin system HicA family toxin [Magnetococcales bacterium]|nr:type II toxin-antitoxin system HicA family toxin [Magnetococcales bacterium]